MNKQQTISFIEEQLASGKISRSDLAEIAGSESASRRSSFDTASDSQASTKGKEAASDRLIRIFYSIGAIIAIAGVSILTAQHWSDIGFIGRISATLGISIAAYIVALLLNKARQAAVSETLFVIAAILAPLGSYVLLKEAGVLFDWPNQIITSLILSAVFGMALAISKKSALVLIITGFATWSYYAIIMEALRFYSYDNNIMKLATMLIGVSYLLIAYRYRSINMADSTDNEKRIGITQSILYGLGTVAILGAGISIGGIFDILFIIFVFGAFYGSVYLRSRAMLLLGGLFLIAHMIKLTSKYFIDSIGWPVSLIIIGFLVISIGYLTFSLNKKFISLK